MTFERVVTIGERPAPRAGWISARGGKWHRATVARPTFTREEKSACGLRFIPLNVTWDGETPPSAAHYLCSRPGCKDGEK